MENIHRKLLALLTTGSLFFSFAPVGLAQDGDAIENDVTEEEDMDEEVKLDKNELLRKELRTCSGLRSTRKAHCISRIMMRYQRGTLGSTSRRNIETLEMLINCRRLSGFDRLACQNRNRSIGRLVNVKDRARAHGADIRALVEIPIDTGGTGRARPSVRTMRERRRAIIGTQLNKRSEFDAALEKCGDLEARAKNRCLRRILRLQSQVR